MAKAKSKDKTSGGTIAQNKRARHEFHIDEHYEAGIMLEGWEVKSLRAGRINLSESYAVVRGSEIFLQGASIPPLISASTHVIANDRRTRKLLLHREEIDKLIGAIERKGYTLV
ncbi:MAG: SsrA-binding protein SmpB, partial [Dokdonella sp.]|uniref:SsrA-binding protein SmpB n=1 Tax=Dokdonella sp. TaxID=2291710 RepID=UPI00326507BF